MSFIFDNIRYINFVLGVLVVVCMTASSIVRRDKLARRTRRVWLWLYLLNLDLLYGTANNLAHDIPLSPPVFIYTIILIGLVASMVWNPKTDDDLPKDDSSLSTVFVLWLDRKIREHKARNGES